MKERWRDIQGEDHYQVSDRGRVRRLACVIPIPGSRASMRRLRLRILKPALLPSGYMQVSLPHLRKVTVHRLVATAFLGKPPFRAKKTRGGKAAHVNHLDNDKANNVLTNLEWATARRNILHSFQTTNRQSSAKGKFGCHNSSSIPVIATCMKTGKETRYAAGADAARKGFGSGGISAACSGAHPSYKGFYWRYERGYGRGEAAP